MRLHIELEDELVRKVDGLAGHRGRSAFVRKAIERAVQEDSRWDELEAAANTIDDVGHSWDRDPARWVRDQRRADQHRAG